MISLQNKSLADYFHHSGQYYYMLTDLEGHYIYLNPLFLQHFVTDSGTPAASTFPAAEMVKLRRAMHQCTQTPDTTVMTKLRLLQEDGSVSVIKWEFSACRDEEGVAESIQAIGTPVTEENMDSREENEQQMPEQGLRLSELFYRNLVADSLDGMLLTDENGIIDFASASVTKILGYESGDLLGKAAFEYVHPADRRMAISAFMDEVKQSPKIKFIAVRLLKKSGEWISCLIRGHNLLSNPHVGRMVIYFYDDTLRKMAEDALIESENRFRGLIYNLHQGVVVQSAEGRVVIFNPAALRLLGLSEDQLLGTSSFDPRWICLRENGQDFPVQERPIPLAFKTKKTVRNVVMGVVRPVTRDRIWLLVNADPVLDAENNIVNVICSFTDITEQKRLSQELIDQEIQKQKQIIQATIDGQEKERLEIGKELHDNINQHLSTTRLYLEVLREKADGESFEMIDLAYKGISSIINEIRQLSQSLVPATLGDLGIIESVQDLCDAIKRAHTFHIDFYHQYFNEEELADNLKLMLFRIIQEQINNIIRHAGANSILVRLQSDAEYITLVVMDNGKGFDPATCKKGLGLTNIINRAGVFNGKIELNSSPGNGCILSVTIPRINPLLV